MKQLTNLTLQLLVLARLLRENARVYIIIRLP